MVQNYLNDNKHNSVYDFKKQANDYQRNYLNPNKKIINRNNSNDKNPGILNTFDNLFSQNTINYDYNLEKSNLDLHSSSLLKNKQNRTNLTGHYNPSSTIKATNNLKFVSAQDKGYPMFVSNENSLPSNLVQKSNHVENRTTFSSGKKKKKILNSLDDISFLKVDKPNSSNFLFEDFKTSDILKSNDNNYKTKNNFYSQNNKNQNDPKIFNNMMIENIFIENANNEGVSSDTNRLNVTKNQNLIDFKKEEFNADTFVNSNKINHYEKLKFNNEFGIYSPSVKSDSNINTNINNQHNFIYHANVNQPENNFFSGFSNNDPNNSIPHVNENYDFSTFESETPFSKDQFFLMTMQFQVLKHILKNFEAGTSYVPEKFIQIVTNENFCFHKSKSTDVLNQNINVPISVNNVKNTHSDKSQPIFYKNNKNINANVSNSNQINDNMKFSFNNTNQGPNTKIGPSINQNSLKNESFTNDSDSVSRNKHNYKPFISKHQILPKSSNDINNNNLYFNKDLKENLNSDFNSQNIFEYNFFDDKIEDIDFKSLFSFENLITTKGLYIDTFDFKEIFENKKILFFLKIDLKNDHYNEMFKMENVDVSTQKNLDLFTYQKNIKDTIASQIWFDKLLISSSYPNYFKKFNSISFENVELVHNLYNYQMENFLKEKDQYHKNNVNIIMNIFENLLIDVNKKKKKINKTIVRIHNFHNQSIKDEQKRIERISKQRLQALKLNDEEAYLKLLDVTKDTRITHLLKQTNQFLESLTQAVQVHQAGLPDTNSQSTIKDNELQIISKSNTKETYYDVAHKIKEKVFQPLILIGGQLKDYQLKGLQWMVSLFNNHLNGILADEMGLGKTIQTISLIGYLINVKNVTGPFLIIVPLSTLTNWSIEFEKWIPSLKIINYKGAPSQRKQLQHQIKKGDFMVLLTTYEYIIKDKNLLSRIKWMYMIIDEGHRMKNTSSKLSETLTYAYHSNYKLILTGTPLQNNLPELWSLLNFVLPKIFNSVKSFDDWFNTPFSNTGVQERLELSEEETLLIIKRLHKVLRPFLLRRLKKDVEKDLPSKVEKIIKCKMSSLQVKLYQQMLKYNLLYVDSPNDKKKPVFLKNVNNQIIQLRKICNHPFVYEEVERLINPSVETNDHIWRVSAKFELLDRILPKLQITGHKVLIFFQMTQIMNIMEDFLRYRNIKYLRLDGNTKSDDRTKLLKFFNTSGSEYLCFLLSTRAGGLGLNLQTADTVIIFDIDWNPHQDLQAQDRAHRIGQKNEVRILRLITEDSVEEMILERTYAKLEIDGKVIQAGKFDNKSTAEEQEKFLRYLFEKEEERRQKLSNNEDDDLNDFEINQIIARNQEELDIFLKIDEDLSLKNKNLNYSTRLFSDSELPLIYKIDSELLLKNEENDNKEYIRTIRKRKVTTYDDNLTEEEWLKKIDGMIVDNDDYDVDVEKNNQLSKPVNKLQKLNTNFMHTTQSLTYDSDQNKKEHIKKQKTDLDSFNNEKINYNKYYRFELKKKKSDCIDGSYSDNLSIEKRTELQKKITTLFNTIYNYKDESGRVLSMIFLVKPSKKLYPDYYFVIKYPIALDTIKFRLQNHIYFSLKEICEDLHLMFANAKFYNKEDSIVYEDATILEILTIKTVKQLFSHLNDEELNDLFNFSEFDNIFASTLCTTESEAKHPFESELNI